LRNWSGGGATEQQADGFRIRKLIGPIVGRADSILKYMANLIEDGESTPTPETQVLCFAEIGSRTQNQPKQSFSKGAMIANILNKPQVQELKKEEILALPAYALVCVDFDEKQAEKNREDIEFHLVIDLDRIYGRNHKSIKRIYRLA
jgi:hypothetical protein